MATVSTIKKNHYQDSMKLMQISQKLRSLDGVKNAAAIMATEANLQMLKEARLIDEIPSSAGANDLIVAVQASTSDKANEAIESLEALLMPEDISAVSEFTYNTMETASGALPGANLAIVSVPGEYAKIEVAKAIEKGFHTFLFSDNVSLEEEIELKERAREKGLLVMGPGCGTAIINGVGLGFANVIEKGPVGVIAAAGTGMQEVTSLLSNLGSGITHAIGVGGRDLSEEVGAITTLQAIKMLENDQDTQVLLLVSKPPSDKVAKIVVDAVKDSGLPSVLCFLGSQLKSEDKDIHFTPTLEEAAEIAFKLSKKKKKKPSISSSSQMKNLVCKSINSLNPKQKYIRGLFSGGTLCYEAQQVLEPIVGDVYSNAPLNKELKLKDSNKSKLNSCIDLGEEEFTVGRPHPMIDATLRRERMIQEASKAEVGVILFDVVLGHVASPDPAGDLIPAITESKKIAKKKGRNVVFVTHVCGTSLDPQVLEEQEEKLRNEGVLVFPTNAQASRASGLITMRGEI